MKVGPTRLCFKLYFVSKTKWVLLSILYLLLLKGVIGQQRECPVVGTNLTVPLTPRADLELRGVYMNFETPSQCTGNVTAWRFCYYVPDFATDQSRVFKAKFRTYRKSLDAPTIYELVSGSSKTIEFTFGRNKSNSFECFVENIPADQQFIIQENDIIGACLWLRDRDMIFPLGLVGFNETNQEEFLYHYDKENYGHCENDRIDEIDTMDNEFMNTNHDRLHLYADIGMFTLFLYNSIKLICQMSWNKLESF